MWIILSENKSPRILNNEQVIMRKASPYIWQHIDYNVLVLKYNYNITSIRLITIKSERY